MLTSFRQKAKIHIPLPTLLDRGEFLKKTFGYLKEAVGRYCGNRQDTMTPRSITILCDKGPDHSTNATAMRPFGPLRMASITRGSEKAAAYPER